jgi:hypothetical protein
MSDDRPITLFTCRMRREPPKPKPKYKCKCGLKVTGIDGYRKHIEKCEGKK